MADPSELHSPPGPPANPTSGSGAGPGPVRLSGLVFASMNRSKIAMTTAQFYENLHVYFGIVCGFGIVEHQL